MEVANVNSQKKNMGRRKIEIRKIEKKSFLEVTFSKCQTGLFKKVGKLCVLCGAEAVVIVFSLGGRAFVFDHPIVKAVIDHFLKRCQLLMQGQLESDPPYAMPLIASGQRSGNWVSFCPAQRMSGQDNHYNFKRLAGVIRRYVMMPIRAVARPFNLLKVWGYV
uniref:MADS-box domain-containing protein n=1 Tax=Vitis vinifera TaxID=29760 RepID=A5AEZ5_VITVI|nr:hypothetical protein VITISV_025678 [Vitis vinifera]